MTAIVLVIIYLSFISLGLPDSMLGSAWPVMHKGFQASIGTAGVITMVISIGTIISSYFSGWILKRFGTATVTVVSVFMTAIALLGISLSPSLVVLILWAIPLGLGAGCVDSGLNHYIASHYKSHHMSWLHCFWGVGAMTGPIIMAWYIHHNFSWRNGYGTVSIIQFFLVFLIAMTLPIWKRQERMWKEKLQEDSSIEQGIPQEQQTKKSIFSLKGVKPALAAFFLYCAIESTLGLWGSSYLVETRGIKESTAAGWISLFYGGITLGRFINGFLTLKLSNKALIRLGQVIILIGTLLILLPLSNMFLLAGLVLAGLGCAPIFPCMLHETPARFGKEHATKLMGIQMATAYSSFTFLPPLFGFITTYTSMVIYPFVILVYVILIVFASERVNQIQSKQSVTSK